MRLTGLVVAAAAFLGGCFYSDEALIGRFSADFPLPEGDYSHTPHHPDGRAFAQATWTGEIVHRGGRYHSDSPDFPHEGARFREIADGLYIVMRPDEEFWLYGLVRVFPDGVAAYYLPDCAELSEAVREDYDIVEHEEEPGFCRVDDWDRLSGAMLSWLATQGDAPPMDGVYRPVAPDRD